MVFLMANVVAIGAATIRMRIGIIENSGVVTEAVGLASGISVGVGDEVAIVVGIFGVDKNRVNGGADCLEEANIGAKLTLPRLKSFFWSLILLAIAPVSVVPHQLFEALTSLGDRLV